MDCDDNELERHAFQFDGDECSQFLSVPLPNFLPPKFEFDDSFSGTLRFDYNSVETEIFIGTENNKENWWIEGFFNSRGEIPFRPSPAESRSVPRVCNVWPEATSSESVEMFLKSAGQPKFIPGKAVIAESDTCDELGCIIKHMDRSVGSIYELNREVPAHGEQYLQGRHGRMLQQTCGAGMVGGGSYLGLADEMSSREAGLHGASAPDEIIGHRDELVVQASMGVVSHSDETKNISHTLAGANLMDPPAFLITDHKLPFYVCGKHAPSTALKEQSEPPSLVINECGLEKVCESIQKEENKEMEKSNVAEKIVNNEGSIFVSSVMEGDCLDPTEKHMEEQTILISREATCTESVPCRNEQCESCFGSSKQISCVPSPADGGTSDHSHNGDGLPEMISSSERGDSVLKVTDSDAGKVSFNIHVSTQNVDPADENNPTSEFIPLADLLINANGKTFQPLLTPLSSNLKQDISHSCKDDPGGDTRQASAMTTCMEAAGGGGQTRQTIASIPEEEEKIKDVLSSPSSICHPIGPNDLKISRFADSSCTKPLLLSPAPILPDLNYSVSASLVFQQPFSDMQQVQLRAQIFVYGALIQGTLPDEAYMISAFGGPDSRRSAWENLWRCCMEKMHGQKSFLASPENPLLQSRVRSPICQEVQQSRLLGNVVYSSGDCPISQASPASESPMPMPLPSLQWSVHSQLAAVASSCPPPKVQILDYPPHVKNFGADPHWISHRPFHAAWLVSACPDPKTAVGSSPRYSSDPKYRARERALASSDNRVRSNFRQLEGFYTNPELCVASTSGNLGGVDKSGEQKASLSEEMFSKVREARARAEEAADFASTAVDNCEEICGQLDGWRESGLSLDVKIKLASAALAITAAAAVARSAAAAASIASNAALQAKLMAEEEMLVGVGCRNDAKERNELVDSEDSKSSSSILVAAREASRMRIEAASAASKRAENMDATVKAAELAADAVSQAGRIVAMGDPVALSELVARGPDGFWKLPHGTSAPLSEAENGRRENRSMDAICSVSISGGEGADNGGRSVDDFLGSGPSVVTREIDAKEQDHEASDRMESTALVAESVKGSIPLEENCIKEGSCVEIFKNNNGVQAAWFSANVLNLKDDMAYVSYSELTSCKGLEKKKEWFPLRGEGDKAPLIRLARTGTAISLEGTRKRPRASTLEHPWSIGDRIEAWMHDRWWEGIVVETSKKEEASTTVNFPVQRKTVQVKPWNLRPLLAWKDGKWVECSSSAQNHSSSHLVEEPKEKRQRIRSPAMETDVGSVNSEDATNKEVNLLSLCGRERTFSTGHGHGLPKSEPRMALGPPVPKIGKKRKLMDVAGKGKQHSGKTSVPKSEPSERRRSVSSKPKTLPSARPARSDPSEKQAFVFSAQPPQPLPLRDKVSSQKTPMPLNKCKLVEQSSKARLVGKVFSSNSTDSHPRAVAEPRRSNRRIQPTSRLLEGLQSSLMIPKLPPVSNDRNSKKTSSRGNSRF